MLSENPISTEAREHLRKGNASARTKHFDEAFPELSMALQLEPNWAEAHHCMGEALAGNGDWDKAVPEYLQALRLKPGFAPACVGLAGVLTNIGGRLANFPDLSSIISDLREALRFMPDWAEAHYNLGIVLYYRVCHAEQERDWSSFDRANYDALPVALFGEAIRLKPDFAEAHYYIGLMLEVGRLYTNKAPSDVHDLAIQRYLKAVKLKPKFAQAHRALALVFCYTKQLEKAFAEYREALSLGLNESEANRDFAAALWTYAEDRPEWLIGKFRELIRLDPNEHVWHSYLCDLLQESGDVDSAIVELRRSASLGGQHDILRLANALEKKGALTEALSEFERLYNSQPEGSDSREKYQQHCDRVKKKMSPHP